MVLLLIFLLCMKSCRGSEDSSVSEPAETSGAESAAFNAGETIGTESEEALVSMESLGEVAVLPPTVGLNLSAVELTGSKAAAYIRDQYALILGRDAQPQEIDGWIKELESGADDGSGLLWNLFNQDELEERKLGDEEYIRICYQACLGCEPKEDRLNYWKGRLEDGERRVFLLYQLLITDECRGFMAENDIDRGSVGAVNNAMQQKVAWIAQNNEGTRAAVGGECAAWVSGVYAAAGLGYPGGNAIDYWDWWQGEGSRDMSQVPVGAAVIGSGSRSDAGLTYGHIGIYLGGGMIAHNAGGNHVTISSIDEFEETYCTGDLAYCYYSAYKGKQGILGWVWPAGNDFSG